MENSLEPTSWLKHGCHILHEIRLEDAALVIAALEVRVRELDGDKFHRSCIQQMGSALSTKNS